MTIPNHQQETTMYDPHDSDDYVCASKAFGVAASEHQCCAESASLETSFSATDETWGSCDDSFSSSDWSSSSWD
jgi:hypothetical protein